MKPKRILILLNHHRLSGALYAGTWTFHSDFPEIPAEFDGATDSAPAVEQFARLATAVVTVEAHTKEIA